MVVKGCLYVCMHVGVYRIRCKVPYIAVCEKYRMT
jgi:hypothetical protein